jgi:hypothetical protein
LAVAAAFIGKEHEFINLAGFAVDFDGVGHITFPAKAGRSTVPF